MTSSSIGVAAAAPLPSGGLPKVKLLYAFSGPEDRADGFRQAAVQAGGVLGLSVEVAYFDIINGSHQDLADQIVFDRVLSDVTAGLYDGGLCSPPCSTFSRARKEGDSGPRPLRGATGPDRYGRSDLTPEERESVRLGTLLEVRAAQISSAFHDLHAPWLTENPPEAEDAVSLFKIDEWQELSGRGSVVRNLLCQCMYGASHTKRTEFRGSVPILGLKSSCSHESRWWRVPPNGRWHFAPHPPLRGRILAVPAEAWSSSMRHVRAPRGAPVLTRATAAYPWGLNLEVARSLLTAVVESRASAERSLLRPRSPRRSPRLVRVGTHGNALVKESAVVTSSPGPSSTARLRGV